MKPETAAEVAAFIAACVADALRPRSVAELAIDHMRWMYPDAREIRYDEDTGVCKVLLPPIEYIELTCEIGTGP